MDCIKANFDKVLPLLKSALGDRLPMHGDMLHYRPGPKPKFTDIEVIALDITAAGMGYNTENHLFEILNSRYKKDFPFLISRRQYNDRRKNLKKQLNEIRQLIVNELNRFTEIFAIDSMPLDVCKLSRSQRNTIGIEHDSTTPDRGFCAAQDRSFFGYKIHALVSPLGVIQYFDITKASTHDIQFLKDVNTEFNNCLIVGDKGYISKPYKDLLWKQSRICLETPYRKNQKDGKSLMYPLRKIRKRIETIFSQLDKQFKIKEHYAKSFSGFIARLLSKITGVTVLQYLNKLNGRLLGKLSCAFK